MTYQFQSFIFVLSFTAITSLPVAAQSEVPSSQRAQVVPVNPNEPQIDTATIRDAVSKRDLNRLIVYGDTLCRRIEAIGSRPDLWNLTQICNALGSYDFGDGVEGDKKRYAIRDKYAVTALRKISQTDPTAPFIMELIFARFLSPGSARITNPSMTVDEFVRYREEEVGYWVHAWARLLGSIDSNHDFSRTPLLDVPVPGGNYMPGTRPEDIREPELRMLYEAKIAENRKIIEQSGTQRDALLFRTTYFAFLNNFLITAYRCEPQDFGKLKQHLADLKDPQLTDSVMKGWALNENVSK